MSLYSSWSTGRSPPTDGDVLVLDRDAHRPGGAGDDLLGLLDVVRVEVGHLLLGDLAQLRLADRTDLVALRDAGALLYARSLDQQAGGRRRLQHERERPVLVHADLCRDDVAALRLGL